MIVPRRVLVRLLLCAAGLCPFLGAAPGVRTALAVEAAGQGTVQEARGPVQNLQAAPDISFTDLNGRTRNLGEFRGRVVLLEFWAPWCAPCREGFVFLDALQTKSGDGLAILAVTMEEDSRSVDDFVQSRPASFLIGRDPGGRSGEVFGVDVMPTSVLIDRDGRIAARYGGGTKAVHEDISRDVEQLLAGGLPADPAGLPVARSTRRGVIRPWERGYLADPIMNLDGDVISRSIEDEIHGSKEAAAGSGGVAGGGCGCN